MAFLFMVFGVLRKLVCIKNLLRCGASIWKMECSLDLGNQREVFCWLFSANIFYGATLLLALASPLGTETLTLAEKKVIQHTLLRRLFPSSFAQNVTCWWGFSQSPYLKFQQLSHIPLSHSLLQSSPYNWLDPDTLFFSLLVSCCLSPLIRM